MPVLFWIILLVVLGIVLFFAELVLLPGVTLAAIGTFLCFCAASAWIFAEYGLTYGFIGLGAIIAIVVLMLILFFRPQTWKKLSLSTELPDSIATPICEQCEVGSSGMALTRLAPMGKVLVDAQTFEAKTMGGYIDEGVAVRVIGYDNQNIIVEKA